MTYDVIIIGSGPAGLTASIYASRYKLTNLVVGKLPGGTATYAHKIENFPGCESISGVELINKMVSQVKALGSEMMTEHVVGIEKNTGEAGHEFKIKTESGKEYFGKTLILSLGTERKKLGVPGEEQFLNRGVSYCTHCDIPFYKDKVVVIVGGSDAACSGALHAADFAKKVYLIYRKNELRAEPAWVEEIKADQRIEVIFNTNLTKILGEQNRVGSVELDTPYQGNKILPVDGVFIEIGGVPASSPLTALEIELDENGYVIVNDKMETNIEGIFAAGDITTKSIYLQQIITACGDGARAAASAFQYLKSKK